MAVDSWLYTLRLAQSSLLASLLPKVDAISITYPGKLPPLTAITSYAQQELRYPYLPVSDVFYPIPRPKHVSLAQTLRLESTIGSQ
jgi:hypothetical protein